MTPLLCFLVAVEVSPAIVLLVLEYLRSLPRDGEGEK